MKIKEILGLDNRETYGLVEVVLDDGTIGNVMIGGNCEVYYHKGTIRVFVKKGENNGG